MPGVEEHFKQEVVEKNTLNNNKLDNNEINFLKTQKEGLKELGDNTVSILLNDIRETNKISFDKNEKVRQMLNSFWMKPDNFLKQLGMEKELPQIKKFLANIDKQLGTEADFYKQTLCMSLLLRKSGYDVLKTGSSNTYDFMRNASQLKSFLFDTGFVKALHAFQSKYASAASSKGWSEADCIIGPKTIQELCSLVGVNPSVGAVEIDVKFSQANYTAKEKYSRASEAQKQIDVIMVDKGINSVQKVKSMVDVCKKTTTKAEDGTDKRYAAIVYMIVNTQMMLPKISETEKQAIIGELSVFGPEIKKYRNEQNTNDKVSKSNDFLKDVNKGIEQNEKNKKQINTALGLSESWIAYYQKESPKAYEKLKPQINKGINMLRSLGQLNTSIDINKQIKNALFLIFRSTEYNKMSSTHQENYIDYRVNKHDIYTPTEMYDNGQEGILQGVINILTDTKTNRKNENQITNIRIKALEQFRLIDKSYDSLIPILDGYNSGDAIVGNILNQDEGGIQNIGSMTIKADGDKEYEKFNLNVDVAENFFSMFAIEDAQSIHTLDGIMKLFDSLNQSTKTGDNQLRYSSLIQLKNTFKGISALSHINTQNDDTVILIAEKYRQVKESMQQKKQEIKNQFQSTLNDGIKELKGDLLFYEKELTHDPNNQEYIKNKNQISLKVKELEGGKIGDKTIDQAADLQVNNMARISFIDMLQDFSYGGIYDENYAAINKLKDKSNPNDREKMILLYSNIMGKGGYTSDKSYDTYLEVTKEVITQVVICAISAGVGSLVMNAAVGFSKRALTGMKAIERAGKLGKYAQLAEMGFVDVARGAKIIEELTVTGLKYTKAAKNIIETTEGVRALTTTERVVATGFKLGTSFIEGGVFHVSSTMLNNAYHGVDITSGLALNNKQNVRGYVQSIAFLGVIKELGGITKGLTERFLSGKITETELNNALNQTVKLNIGQKLIINTASFGGELVSMGVADQLISLAFDGKFKDVSVKDMTQMVGMIIGLRLTHKFNPLNGINKKLNDYIVKDVTKGPNGEIVDIKFKTEQERFVISKNGKMGKIVEMQKDGALVLYEGSNGPTFTKYENLKTFEFAKDMEVLNANGIKGKIVEMQKDGALVLYEGSNGPTFTKYENLKTFEFTKDMEVLSANGIKGKIVEVQKDGAIVLYEGSNGPTFTKYENLKTFEFTKDMEVLSANGIKGKIVEVQKDGAIVLYEGNTTPTFTKYENLKTFESLMKKDFKQKKSATEKNKKQEVQIKDEEIISQDNQPIKIEIPPELIHIDGQEFKSQAGKILDLNDMGKYQIAKVETTDGGFYIIKPLGKGEYEILSSKPQVPTGQKVGILETDGAMHFDMQSSLGIKTIQEVVLLNPIVKNKISVIEKPVIKHANIYENEIELQKLVNNKLNEYNNLREPFNEKYFDETKNEYILDENGKKDYDYIINLREEIKYDLGKLTTIKEGFIQLDGIFGKIEKPQNIKIPNISGVFEKDIIRSDGVKEKIYVNKDILKDILVESNGETVRYGTNRLFILAKVGDTIIPFYRSSEGTSGKTTGKWYPFFGETEHWIVKGTVESDGTMEYNNKELTAVTDIINKNFIIPPDMLFTGFKKGSNNSESAEDFTQVENLLIAPIGGTYDDCISLDDIVGTHVLFKTGTSNDFTGFHPNEKLINRGGGSSKIRYDNIVNRIGKKNPIMIDKDVVKKNAALNDSDRIKEAKNILGYNVSLLQEQAILEAHKLPGEIYNLSLAEIRAKVEVLKKAEFTSEQIRVLMENGICGTDGLSDNSGVEGAVMNNNVSSKSKESDSGIKTEMENKEVINKSSPEIVNKNILNESIILEKDLILIDKELNDPVDKTSNDNIPFADKVSKFATFLTKVDVYTKSIEKIAAQKDVLFEKTNTFIKTNLQKMKEVLMHRPQHIIKEIYHIQTELTGYADAYKNTSGFLSKSAHALGILRTSLHPLMEVRHKVNNVMEYFEGEYDHEKSEAMSMMIKSVNHSLFEAELGLIRIDERIKTKKIEQHFELKIDELHLAIQNPSEYISLLYDIIIENPKFGYNEQHMQEIKTLTNNINFNEPISEDVHNDILGLLFSNVKPQIH